MVCYYYDDCIHKAKAGYVNTICLACRNAYWERTNKADLYRTEKCKHMRDNGTCSKNASSCGYCKRSCSYFERQKSI